MNVYVTLDELRAYLPNLFEEGVQNDADPMLKRFCIQASRVFDTFATNGASIARHFYPVVATRNYDQPDCSDVLVLRDDLLELTTLTTKNGTVTITSADYILQGAAGQYGRTPYSKIVLQPNGTITQYDYTDSPLSSQGVSGIWGYHRDWANAWEDTGDTVQDAALNGTATTITVSDAGGDDINGIGRRFQVMQLLRIEDEYLWLTGVNDTDNTLTVRRGMNGSTAAAHAQNTAIYAYKPMPQLTNAIAVLARYMYQRRDNVGGEGDRAVITPQGHYLAPHKLPDEVKGMLVEFRKDTL